MANATLVVPLDTDISSLPPLEADISTLPEWEMKSFARWLYKATEKYFEDPDVKRRFEEWMKEKNQASVEKTDIQDNL